MEIQNRASFSNGRANHIGAHISHIGQRQEIKRGGLKGDVRTSNFGRGTFLGIVPGFISSRSVELLSGEKSRGNQEIYYCRDWYTNVVCPSNEETEIRRSGKRRGRGRLINYR